MKKYATAKIALIIILGSGFFTKNIYAKQVDQKKGLETVDYPATEIGLQGNWRKKKDWLKKAIEKNDSIQDIVADLQSFRGVFYQKSQSIDAELNDFYQATGFNQGEVSVLFEEIEEEIKQGKKRTRRLFSIALSEIDDEESLEEAEQIKAQFADAFAIDEKFKKYKNNLEQLKLDMKSIADLKKSVYSRLNEADNQIKIIHSQAEMAQGLSKKVWHVIDDKKARDIFYELNRIHVKVMNLQNFVKKDLLKDLDLVVQKIREQINKTGVAISNLEKQGIIVMNRAERIGQQKAEMELAEKEEEKKREERRKERVKRKKAKPTSWWEKTKSFFHWISSLF